MTNLLTKKETAARIGWHPEHLMKMVRKGRFPAPIKLTNKLQGGVRFVEDEISQWIEQKLKERSTTFAPSSDRLDVINTVVLQPDEESTK